MAGRTLVALVETRRAGSGLDVRGRGRTCPWRLPRAPRLVRAVAQRLLAFSLAIASRLSANELVPCPLSMPPGVSPSGSSFNRPARAAPAGKPEEREAMPFEDDGGGAVSIRSIGAKACSLSQQPVTWAGVALGLAALGGPRGRRAALRGTVSYAVAGVAANLLIKPVSFPSGHSATEVAFALAAAQELPGLLMPLLVASAAGKWSIGRTRGHYVGDIVAGSLLGVGVARALWKLWPPAAHGPDGQAPPRGPKEFFEESNHYRFRSVWRVEAPARDVYPVLERVEDYPLWWPEVKEVYFTPERWVKIRALLPYTLQFSLTQTSSPEDRQILEASMDGDLRGWSRWSLSEEAEATFLLFEEDVEVGKRSLRAFALFARPMFKANHALMMWRGRRGLRNFLG